MSAGIDSLKGGLKQSVNFFPLSVYDNLVVGHARKFLVPVKIGILYLLIKSTLEGMNHR